VIEVARGEPRHVVDHLPHDLAVDPAVYTSHPIANRAVELRRRQPGPVDRVQVDHPPRQRDGAERHPQALAQLDQQPALPPRGVGHAALRRLAPRVRGDVLRSAGVVHVGVHPRGDVVVPQRHVVELVGPEIGPLDRRRAGAERDLRLVGQHALHLAVGNEHVQRRRGVSCDRGPRRLAPGGVRHAQHREPEPLEHQPPRLLRRHVHAVHGLEQPEDRSRLHRARRVVVPGEHHDGCRGKPLAEAAQLLE
jgi:hypothetical protein